MMNLSLKTTDVICLARSQRKETVVGESETQVEEKETLFSFPLPSAKRTESF